MSHQKILVAEFPSSMPEARLALFIDQSLPKQQMTLCSQTWAEGIGWFTQSSIPIEPCQLAAFRQTLMTGRVPSVTAPKIIDRPMERLRIVG